MNIDDTIIHLTTQIERLQCLNTARTLTIQDQAREIDNLRSESASDGDEIRRLEAQVETQRHHINALINDRNESGDSFEELHAENASLIEALDSHRDRTEVLERENAALRAQSLKREEEAKALRADILSLEHRVLDLTEKAKPGLLAMKDELIRNLKARINRQLDDLDKVQRLTQVNAGVLLDRGLQVQRLERTIEQYRTDTASFASIREKLEAEIKALQHALNNSLDVNAVLVVRVMTFKRC
jgi:chromosome segregation ATPase